MWGKERRRQKEAERQQALYDKLYGGERVKDKEVNTVLTRKTRFGRKETLIQKTDGSYVQTDSRGVVQQEPAQPHSRRSQRSSRPETHGSSSSGDSVVVSLFKFLFGGGGQKESGGSSRKKSREQKHQPVEHDEASPTVNADESVRDRRRRLKREGHRPDDIDYFMEQGLTEYEAKRFDKSGYKSIKKWRRDNA